MWSPRSAWRARSTRRWICCRCTAHLRVRPRVERGLQRCVRRAEPGGHRVASRDRVFLDALGTSALPDPATARIFCRRFDPKSVMALQAAINRSRLKVWSRQVESFLDQTARIDADEARGAATKRTSTPSSQKRSTQAHRWIWNTPLMPRQRSGTLKTVVVGSAAGTYDRKLRHSPPSGHERQGVTH
jgi:hypothetical protein